MSNSYGVCPNCGEEMGWTRVKDIDSGDVLITCSIVFCPECLYISQQDVDISK